MLMTGSLGMLASTLPVQWLMPLIGWRPLLWILAAMILLSMTVIGWVVPTWKAGELKEAEYSAGPSPATPASSNGSAAHAVTGSGPAANYSDVWRNLFFQKMAPLAVFNYGGLIAVQTLWAGPWMVKVAGYSALELATGLFLHQHLHADNVLELGHA